MIREGYECEGILMDMETYGVQRRNPAQQSDQISFAVSQILYVIELEVDVLPSWSA